MDYGKAASGAVTKQIQITQVGNMFLWEDHRKCRGPDLLPATRAPLTKSLYHFRNQAVTPSMSDWAAKTMRFTLSAGMPVDWRAYLLSPNECDWVVRLLPTTNHLYRVCQDEWPGHQRVSRCECNAARTSHSSKVLYTSANKVALGGTVW